MKQVLALKWNVISYKKEIYSKGTPKLIHIYKKKYYIN